MARDLKYRPVETDFESLERELRGHDYNHDSEPPGVPDAYADLAEQYNEDDDDGHLAR